jgi:Kazal-type serine protease inhibitor domain
VSADNWATCVKCLKDAQTKEKAEREAVAAQYGKVPIAEFDRLREALEPVHPEDFGTFREDYEVYNDNCGTVQVTYSGSCHICGLELKFEHTHEILGEDK